MRNAWWAGALLALAALGAGGVPARAEGNLELGGGLFAPGDGDNRAAFGTSFDFNLGYSVALGSHGGWAFLETGLIPGSGDYFYPDPTFERGPTRYRLVPLVLGLRQEMLGHSDREQVRVFLGLAFEAAFIHLEIPAQAAFDATAKGMLVELQPDFPLGGRWRYWMRVRGTLLSRPRDDAGRVSDYSGGSVQLGLSLKLP